MPFAPSMDLNSDSDDYDEDVSPTPSEKEQHAAKPKAKGSKAKGADAVKQMSRPLRVSAAVASLVWKSDSCPPSSQSAAPVGSRIRVWWQADEMWYRGTVKAYTDAVDTHVVVYDDGDQRNEALSNPSLSWELLQLLEPPPLPPTALSAGPPPRQLHAKPAAKPPASMPPTPPKPKPKAAAEAEVAKAEVAKAVAKAAAEAATRAAAAAAAAAASAKAKAAAAAAEAAEAMESPVAEKVPPELPGAHPHPISSTHGAPGAIQQAQAKGLKLRVADNTTGYFGVSLYKCKSRTRRYRADVRRSGKSVCLGRFVTAEEAALCVARSPEGQKAAAAPAAAPYRGAGGGGKRGGGEGGGGDGGGGDDGVEEEEESDDNDQAEGEALGQPGVSASESKPLIRGPAAADLSPDPLLLDGCRVRLL